MTFTFMAWNLWKPTEKAQTKVKEKKIQNCDVFFIFQSKFEEPFMSTDTL